MIRQYQQSQEGIKMKNLIFGFIVGLMISGIAWAGIISPAVDVDKAAIKDNAISMVVALDAMDDGTWGLDNIIANIEGASIAQTQAVIKRLAQNQQHIKDTECKIIKFIARNL